MTTMTWSCGEHRPFRIPSSGEALVRRDRAHGKEAMSLGQEMCFSPYTSAASRQILTDRLPA